MAIKKNVIPLLTVIFFNLRTANSSVVHAVFLVFETYSSVQLQ